MALDIRDSAGEACRRPLAGAAAALGAMAAFQSSGAIALPVSEQLGVPGTSGLRFAFAAVLLAAIARPRLRVLRLADVGWLVVLGVVLASMNLLSYAALTRVPLGTATTIETLGPLAVVLGASRRLVHVAWAVVGAVGVALIAGPSADADPLGLLFAVLTAIVLAGYLLLLARLGRRASGLEPLTLAIAVAAVVGLPFAGGAVADVTPAAACRIGVSALLGVGVAYWLDARALRFSGPRRVGMLMTLDPALAFGVGVILLGQHVPPRAMVGLVLVGVASAACQPSGADR
jgi:inner membrane transporter RhtA